MFFSNIQKNLIKQTCRSSVVKQEIFVEMQNVVGEVVVVAVINELMDVVVVVVDVVVFVVDVVVLDEAMDVAVVPVFDVVVLDVVVVLDAVVVVLGTVVVLDVIAVFDVVVKYLFISTLIMNGLEVLFKLFEDWLNPNIRN